MNLVLASGSPRRRELLARLTSDFLVFPSRIDESGSGTPAERAVAAAKAKARAIGRAERGIIIGADTIVAVGADVLGKPATRDQAKGMLTLIEHERAEIKTPRNFNIDPTGAFCLVANQGGDSVVVFRIDSQTGALQPTDHKISIARPVCIRFLTPRQNTCNCPTCSQ